ncbi:MAG: hypothetical protein WC620_07230 [Methanoregula sp.]|jgi:hypothetical protein
MVTVFIQGNWVTIPLGNAEQLPEPGSEECTKMKGTSPLANAGKEVRVYK